MPTFGYQERDVSEFYPSLVALLWMILTAMGWYSFKICWGGRGRIFHRIKLASLLAKFTARRRFKVHPIFFPIFHSIFLPHLLPGAVSIIIVYRIYPTAINLNVYTSRQRICTSVFFSYLYCTAIYTSYSWGVYNLSNCVSPHSSCTSRRFINIFRKICFLYSVFRVSAS